MTTPQNSLFTLAPFRGMIHN